MQPSFHGHENGWQFNWAVHTKINRCRSKSKWFPQQEYKAGSTTVNFHCKCWIRTAVDSNELPCQTASATTANSVMIDNVFDSFNSWNLNSTKVLNSGLSESNDQVLESCTWSPKYFY